MYLIIGGVERDISQVETFAEYVGGDALAKMTASEIFYGARANKLSSKVLQIAMDKAALQLARGESISIPSIHLPPVESFAGDTNFEKAKNAELHYAQESDRLAGQSRLVKRG